MAASASRWQAVNKATRKRGFLAKIASYLGNIVGDYQAVVTETIRDIRDRPIRGTTYLSALAALCVLLRTNPDEREYLTNLLDSSNDLSLIGESVRNPNTSRRIDTILEAYRDGRLKYVNFLFVSFMWAGRFNSNVQLYEAQCSHLKNVFTYHKYVLDVGALGRWWTIIKVMDDYDINPREWGENAAEVE